MSFAESLVRGDLPLVVLGSVHPGLCVNVHSRSGLASCHRSQVPGIGFCFGRGFAFMPVSTAQCYPTDMVVSCASPVLGGALVAALSWS